jgi:hypothetical protein
MAVPMSAYTANTSGVGGIAAVLRYGRSRLELTHSRRGSRVGKYKRRTVIERYGGDAAMPDVLNEISAFVRKTAYRSRGVRRISRNCGSCDASLKRRFVHTRV